MTVFQHNLRKIGVNTFAVLGGDVLNKAGIFIVYAILSRRAGVHEFGQLALGLLVLYTFHVFAVAGLPVALTRQVARRPSAAKRLLRRGYLAALLPSTLSALAMAGLAVVMQYESSTLWVIWLLALAVPPYALAMVTESVIKGREQMHLIPLGNIPGNVLLVAGTFAVLAAGYGVVAVAGMVAASRLITLAVMHALLHRCLAGCRPGRLSPRRSWWLLRRSMVFLGTDGVQAIGASLSGLLLSKFATEREVGLLGASFQLLQPVLMFYRSVGHSTFPQLVAAAKLSGEAVGKLSHAVLGLILWLAFPAALTMFCLAGDLLATVYGNSHFRDGAVVLQTLALTLLLDPLNPVLGHGLWAMGRDKTVLRIVMVNAVTAGLVGFVLIGQYGLIGAAWTALACSLVNVLQHLASFERGVARLRLGSRMAWMLPPALIAIACVALLPVHRFGALAFGLTIYLGVSIARLEYSSMRIPLTPRSVD